MSRPNRYPTARSNQQLAQQRGRVHRQLRLMFIYPVVYIVMWLIPFVNHCMTYRDSFARRPLYWLSLLSIMSFALMGVVDCLIFSLRERPWRHIPDSDSSFFGSFACWRSFPSHANGTPVYGQGVRRPGEMLQRTMTEANPETPCVEKAPGWLNGVVRAGRSVRTSGSSDVAIGQAVAARTRLEMEKEERRAGLRAGEGRRKSVVLDAIESPEEFEEVDLTAGERERC